MKLLHIGKARSRASLVVISQEGENCCVCTVYHFKTEQIRKCQLILECQYLYLFIFTSAAPGVYVFTLVCWFVVL